MQGGLGGRSALLRTCPLMTSVIPSGTQPIPESTQNMTYQLDDRPCRPDSYILIHTDGACLGNPGPGGYAAVLQRYENDKVTKTAYIKGGEAHTTNNRMELRAAIMALRKLRPDEPLPIIVRSDSQIVVRGMTEWTPKWISNGWRTANRKPVENQDLWKELVAESSERMVSFEWVRGHNGDEFNEEVDRLATMEAQRRRLAMCG
jgi:ribonuclease HI